MSRRDQIRMTDEEIWAYLAEPSHLGTVATIGPDGGAHLVTVGYVVLDGELTILSYKKTQKLANLQRDPRISLLVESGVAYAERRGIQINGIVSFCDDQDYIYRVLDRLAVQYPDIVNTEVRAAARRSADPSEDGVSKRVAIIVKPSRIISWDHRKLNGAY
jgi:PPOX class probable F420-dependent enzyme